MESMQRDYLQANPGNTDTNAFPAVNFQMKVFVCPSNTRPTTTLYAAVNYEITSYMGIAGTISGTNAGDGILFSTSQVSFRDVTDGTSNTAIVGERPCTSDLYYGWGFAPYGSNYGDGDSLLDPETRRSRLPLEFPRRMWDLCLR